MKHSLAIVAMLALGIIWAADGPESANIRGESTTTRKRLVQAEQLIQNGKVADAIDELQRILDEAGDDLVTADGKQFFAARHYVHQFLAKLPDAELKKYRDRVEEPAAKLLALGKARHDAKPLRELLDRYAISRPAEEAILLLADLAFERGAFATAERFWKQLLPEADARYPSPKSDVGGLKAKIILSTSYRGLRTVAVKLFEEFEKAHPNGTGKLAGMSGKLTEILAEVLNRPTAIPGNTAGESRWTNLGGSPSRDGQVSGKIQRHWPSRPTWKTPIPLAATAAKSKVGRPPSVGAVKSLAFHPVVMGSRAYIADAGRVIAFELQSGTAQVVFDGKPINRPLLAENDSRIPSPVDADYTLTAGEGKLYFRYGSPDLFPLPEEGEQPTTTPSALVCLTTPTGSAADALPTQLVWTRFPPVAEGVPASWEGSPLLAEGHLFAAFVRSDAGRIIHAIACYREEGDRPLWVTDVCEEASAVGRTRHELLTLAGRNVVYCSHSGVVAAVNAETGKHAWAFRYPRIRRYPADGKHRDLSPSVAADGRVFVAPNDADQLFAFEADTGKLLWQDGPLLFDHIIGSSAGKVIATIAGPQRGIRAYDTTTGSCDSPLGWRNHDDPFLPSFGRGLLTDEVILWPTSAALYSIRLTDGTVATQPLRGPHGNLAFARNVLLVATPTELWGYVQDTDNADPVASPLPPLIGSAPAFPSVKPLTSKIELLPVVRLPAQLDCVSAKPEVEGLNFGELSAESENTRHVVRQIREETRLLDAHGNGKRLDIRTPDHAIFHTGQLLLADRRTLAIVKTQTGTTQHQFTLPSLLPDMTHVVPFERFVILTLGFHQLVAADTANKNFYWAIDSQERRGLSPHTIESAPRIVSVTRWANQLVVQLSTGTWWIVDAQTGRVLRNQSTMDRPWLSKPESVPNGRLAVVDHASQVSLLDADHRRLWSYDAGREASLTGEPAEVRFVSEKLFAFFHRNQGVEIESFKVADGTRVWPSGPAFLAIGSLDVNGIAADEERLYVPQSDSLSALKLDTGRAAWTATLPVAAPWRAVMAKNCLVVFSGDAIATEPNSALAAFARYPHPRRVFGLLHTAVADYFQRTVPILLFDPRSGELQQRLDLPAAGSVSVQVAADGVWIAAGGAIYRLH